MEANLTYTSYSEDDQSEQDYFINMEEVVDNHFVSNDEFEFEFQSSSVSTFSFPAADHLFHNGKLLTPDHQNDDYDYGSLSTFTTPIFTPTATSANNTPFESCNISPSESRRHVSGELDPGHDYHCGEEKKHPSWAKKMLKPASNNKWTTYLKSLFTKKQCSNERFKTGAADKDRRKKQSFSKPKTASSSSSSSSDSLIRTELENPIQAAIAHCKRSHKQMYSKQIAAI